MQEISQKKKKFLETIGIDINNLPPELKKYSYEIESTFSKEEIDFLKRESLTGRYKKTFCLKDLLGTIHSDYTDKTWLEAFLLSKRGDRTVEEYFANPEYYFVGLKQQDQSNLRHDSPIELYESNGKFFINGGNNRLSLIMMKYLAETSKAQTEEEKAKIDEKYTFVAEVQPTPKDKDIMYMINMIREAYGTKAIIKRTADNEEDCKYTIKIGEKTININNKEELEQALKDSYKVEKVESLEELQYNILNLIQDRIIYEARTDQNRGRILNNIFPDLQKFQQSFVKLKRFGIENKLYEGIDLKNLSFSELSSKAIEMAELEEERIKEKQAIEEIKRREDEERKRKEAEEARARKLEQSKRNIAYELKKEHMEQQAKSIIDTVEATYYELKQEQDKFSALAKKLEINYIVTKIEDTSIKSVIEQIKRNIEKIDNPEKISEILQEIENLTTKDETIKSEYSVELKEAFARSFDAKVQELIRNSKILKLEGEMAEIESEKVSIIGKLMGKEKLKQAKIDNINLKMQLLISEAKKNKLDFSLEDSLSDLCTYSKCEVEENLIVDINEFVKKVETEPELQKMIDEEKLKDKYNQKVDSAQSEIQLIPLNDNGKVSNRYQANILQLQNSDMNRQIQNNRARTIIKQNDLEGISIKSNSSLNKFQNVVNKINSLTQLRDITIER